MSVKKKKIYVKITRCGHRNYWYKKYIGRIYEVVHDKEFDDWWVTIRCLTNGARIDKWGIRKLDSKIVRWNMVPDKTRRVRCL